MGQYQNTKPDGTVTSTVAVTGKDTYEQAAALYAAIEGEYKGTDNLESRQVVAILSALERGQPLDTAEWDALQRLGRKYAQQVDELSVSPDWHGQNPMVPTKGTGRVMEALALMPGGRLPMREDAVAADAEPSTGAMVALYPDAAVARKLAQDGGLAADDLHITLAYLGPAAMLRDPEALRHAVGRWASRTAPLTGMVSGVGHFTNGTQPVTYASADVPGLEGMRQDLVDKLGNAGAPASGEHGFTPHITLAYADTTPDVDNLPLTFDHAALVVGDQRTNFPLSAPRAQDPLRLSSPTAQAAVWRLREGTPEPPPGLKVAVRNDKAEQAGKPAKECGTCRMYDMGFCWGYGQGYGSSFPTDEAWVCDSWQLDPDWEQQDPDSVANVNRELAPLSEAALLAYADYKTGGGST